MISVSPGQVWRRGRKQVEVLGVIDADTLAPRVKLSHWDCDGRVTFRLLAEFVREYEFERAT